MKFLRTKIAWVFLFGMLIMHHQQVKADVFTRQFGEDLLKSVTIGTVTNLTTLAACGFLYGYLHNNLEQNAGSVKEHGAEDNDKAAKNFMTVYLPGAIKTTLKDVAGNAGAKADIQDILSYLKNPQAFTRIGAKIPKGILMNGLPGNGKTLMASAIAGEVNCPFISVSGSSFAEMYIGIGAFRVRLLFQEARLLAQKYGACLIFIDEIDAVAQKRSSGGGVGDRDSNQTVGQLLQSMDGLVKDENPIIVIAATNRVEVLDPAIVRPGRFDRKVDVKNPEIKDRVELLTNALRKVNHAVGIDILRIARVTSGFSGAQLAQLINESAIIAVQAGKGYISIDDIELAYDHITLGREIQGMELNEDDRWITAIHEAGHAAGYLFSDNKRFAVHKASIVPRSHTLGVVWAVTLHESHQYVEEDMRAKIIVALCGSLAEQEFGYSKSSGPSSDLAKARSIAYDMVVRYGMSEKLSYISYDEIDRHLPDTIATEIHREVQKIVDECLVVAQKIVAKHKGDIEKIARLLMKKGTVLGDEIYRLVHVTIPTTKFA
ncbi:AAA family ATPase [Candidatus Babeliales bacterium]|nr:AAA family ATPase [Candidatus Babeliales bacterium]MBP9843683.1 AAA family ATPase [Candidatus Babeliales bacterium]